MKKEKSFAEDLLERIRAMNELNKNEKRQAIYTITSIAEYLDGINQSERADALIGALDALTHINSGVEVKND